MIRILLPAAVVFLLAPVAWAGPLIGGASDGIIYDIDTITGLASNPRDTQIDDLVDLAFGPDRRLYASADGALYTIDTDTGASTVVGAPLWGTGIDFDPTTGTLFVVGPVLGASLAQLLTIDIATWTWADHGIIYGHQNGALAFDGDGSLYLLDDHREDQLVKLDKSNGNTLAELSLSTPLWRAGFDFAPDGTLFVVDGGSSGMEMLYTLDVTSGNLTQIGASGVPGGIIALAFIPEPATLILLLGGAALAMTRRRRRVREGTQLRTFDAVGGIDKRLGGTVKR